MTEEVSADDRGVYVSDDEDPLKATTEAEVESE